MEDVAAVLIKLACRLHALRGAAQHALHRQPGALPDELTALLRRQASGSPPRDSSGWSMDAGDAAAHIHYATHPAAPNHTHCQHEAHSHGGALAASCGGGDTASLEALATEALEVYAVVAGRLGCWGLKAALEDAAFAVLHPAEYHTLAAQVRVKDSGVYGSRWNGSSDQQGTTQ
jgi:hypothetical protein